MKEVHRNVKDRLFRRLFSNKENLLSLFNALSGTHYDNVDDLTVNTLEDVIYLTMKNDLSCIIDDRMCLSEHQSTFNPNMPLRGLIYFVREYENYLEGTNKNKYMVEKL